MSQPEKGVEDNNPCFLHICIYRAHTEPAVQWLLMGSKEIEKDKGRGKRHHQYGGGKRERQRKGEGRETLSMWWEKERERKGWDTDGVVREGDWAWLRTKITVYFLNRPSAKPSDKYSHTHAQTSALREKGSRTQSDSYTKRCYLLHRRIRTTFKKVQIQDFNNYIHSKYTE